MPHGCTKEHFHWVRWSQSGNDTFFEKTHNNPTNTWATRDPKPNLHYRRKLILEIQCVGFGGI